MLTDSAASLAAFNVSAITMATISPTKCTLFTRHDEVFGVKARRAGTIDQRDIDAVAADSGRQVGQGRQVADVSRQQDRKHAAHCLRCAGVDRADARMRMRRPHEHGVRDRPIQLDIVDVAAAPGGEADILPPQHMVADMDAAA